MIHRFVSCTTALLLFLNSFAPAIFAFPRVDTDTLRAVSTQNADDAKDRLAGDPSWAHPASLPAAKHARLEEEANARMSARFEARRAMVLWDSSVQRQHTPRSISVDKAWQGFLR